MFNIKSRLKHGKRSRLMMKGDWQGLSKMFGLTHIDPQAQEAGMHKAIIESLDLPKRTRQASLDWLNERGLKGAFGIALPKSIDDKEP